MDVIVKGFSSLMLTLFLVMVGSGIVAYSIQVRSANAFASGCARRIEYSHYSRDVIEECRQNAANRGYELSVVSYGTEGGSKMGVLELEYDSFLQGFGVEHKRRICLEV